MAIGFYLVMVASISILISGISLKGESVKVSQIEDPKTLFCGNCGQKHSSEDAGAFCGNCGTKLD